MRYTTVVVRTPEQFGGPGGNTCAVIDTEFDEQVLFNHKDPNHSISKHIIEKIRAAVDAWAHESPEARSVIEGINYDFNFGDLAEECAWTPEDPVSLAHYLRQEGFDLVRISTPHDDDDHFYCYDDHLIDEFELKEHYEEGQEADDYQDAKRNLLGPDPGNSM